MAFVLQGLNVQTEDGGQARRTVVVDAAGNVIGSGGNPAKVRVEKVRPNDTNAYIAYDAIAEDAAAGTVWTFPVARAVGGGGLIVGATVACDNVLNTARLELDLYDDTITATNDNAEATHLYTSDAKLLETLTFGAMAKRTTNSTKVEAALRNLAVPFRCAAASLNLLGILRTLDGFTPVALSKYSVTLLIAVRD